MGKLTKKRTFDFISGEALLINKPIGWTSFDVVNHLRKFISRLLGINRIKLGHAGTLDPMATGLLILCTGKLTKRIEEYMGLEKEYTGTIILGATTPSYDSETEINETFNVDHITKELLLNAAAKFQGTIEQLPPKFSAIKIDGIPAYRYARDNIEVEIKSRVITIYSFDITRFDLPEVDFKIVCSKGTYIRSVARDLGVALSSGAYLSSLCRTRIGEYRLEDAYSIDEFKSIISNP